MHLTVISYSAILDIGFEHVALVVDPERDPKRRAFVRCQRPAQLLNAVAAVARPVHLLDLYGHGAPGRITLGDELLLDPRPRSWKVITELEPFLSQTATIRLLACSTAVGEPGFRLLRGLSAALGGRPILGTTASLSHRDFDACGLRKDVAARWLVSSKRLQAPARQRRRSEASGGLAPRDAAKPE